MLNTAILIFGITINCDTITGYIEIYLQWIKMKFKTFTLYEKSWSFMSKRFLWM